MTSGNRQDLVALVADRSMEAVVAAFLGRSAALQIREIRFVCLVHPERDPGCLLRGHELLRSQASMYNHALVIFDRKGCGAEDLSRDALEERVEGLLSGAGWGSRARAVTLDPELETWIWSEAAHVGETLGWQDAETTPRAWLESRGMWRPGKAKPDNPKEAVDAVLMLRTRRPRSSSLYSRIAERISLEKCQDPSFHKFRAVLREWFPISS